MNFFQHLQLTKVIIFHKFNCPKCKSKSRHLKKNIFKKIHYIKIENYNIDLDRPSIVNKRKREEVLSSKFIKRTIYNYKCPKCNSTHTLREF